VIGNENVAGLQVGVTPTGLMQRCERGGGFLSGVGCAFAVMVRELPAVGEARRDQSAEA
jgi:hypothetical protein